MLVVHRKVGERIVLSGGIEITVLSSTRNGVRLAVTAPPDVLIARGELHDAVAKANQAAATNVVPFDEDGAEPVHEMDEMRPSFDELDPRTKTQPAPAPRFMEPSPHDEAPAHAAELYLEDAR
ncbi:MAG: carbon storage regulator [Polyangiaceae bacterium]